MKHTVKGDIQFPIKGQKALPKWLQENLTKALDTGSAPESLRFQCRVAMDAREVFSKVDLNDGETFTLHGKALPQFGKNLRGLAYLTVTGTYSGDGRDYTVTWTGDAIPREMQLAAVKHDEGRYVKRVIVHLRWEDAKIVPSTSGKRRGDIDPSTGKVRPRRDGSTGGKRKTGRKVRCAARLCRADVS